MALLVVDPLEGVQVAHDQAERRARPAGPFDLDVEHLLEPAPVEELGERVAVGGVGEARDQGGHPVAHHRDEEPAGEERAGRGDPAVEVVARRRLRDERDGVPRRGDGEVEQGDREREEVEREQDHPDVRQRSV
jgi:hypothetical protein